jgi:hypothetical protein
MMRVAALTLGALAMIACDAPAAAQGNDNDYTPLNSRIRRDRQFPTDIVNHWVTQTDSVSRARSRLMINQFANCIFKRNKSGAYDLLQKTDLGFNTFEQVGMENDKAAKIYGFHDCLGHVAQANSSSVMMRWTAGGLRSWLVEEAYFERYQHAPTWVRPGLTIVPRELPLASQMGGVRAALELADCVVATDPYTADFFYRTGPGSPEEKAALDTLSPSFGPCVPRGQQLQLSIPLVRLWIGEALWHASQHSSVAAPAGG